MKFRDTEPTGNKFEGGEQRILWENTFKKEIENQSTCRPCRYVGTAEFSFFPQMGGAHTRLWTRPQAPLRDLRWARAQLLRPLKCPQQGKLWSRLPPIQSTNRDEHRVRRAAQMCHCGPFRRLCHYCVCYETQI